MSNNVATQMRSLAKAVALAFSSSDITPEEASSNVLTHTDIPWSNPPLKCYDSLEDVPLSFYFDCPMIVEDGMRLHEFWRTAMDALFERGRHVISHGAFQGLNKATKASLGQKAFRFSIPEGYPFEMPAYTGVCFSLEAAHTAKLSIGLADFVDEDDNYFAVLPNGQIIGVKDGVPALPGTRWDVPAKGLVQDFLTTPRGATTYDCLYDQVARTRSLLWEHKKRFRDWQALDYSLQALRKLSLGSYCPPLLGASQTAIIDVMVLQARELALRQAMEVMTLNTISDRAKVLTVQQLLIPLVTSKATFRLKVYNSGPVIPYTIQDRVMQKISVWLRHEYETHIPNNLKRV